MERRLLSNEELDRVVKLQAEQQSPLTRLVVELGLLSEEDLLPVLRDHFDIPVMSLRDIPNTTLPIELPPGIGDFFKLARMVPVMTGFKRSTYPLGYLISALPSGINLSTRPSGY